MPDTIRKRNLDTLKARLEESKLFTWGVDPSVNFGKVTYKKTELPAISIFARSESTSRTDYGTDSNALIIDIGALMLVPRIDGDGAKENVFDLSELTRGELISAAVTANFGDLANKFEYTGSDVEYPADEDQALVVNITCLLEYETAYNNPYK